MYCVLNLKSSLADHTFFRESSADDRAGQMGRQMPIDPDGPVRNFLAPLPVKSESAPGRRIRTRSRKKVGAERKLWRREPTMGKAVSPMRESLVPVTS